MDLLWRTETKMFNRVGMIEDGITLLQGETDALLTAAGDGLLIRAQREDRVREVLARLPGVEGAPHVVDGQLQVRIQSDFDTAAALVQLVESGAGVEEYARQRAGLVDVFHQALEGTEVTL